MTVQESVIVTGGSSGIGLGIVERLSREYRVYNFDKNEARSEFDRSVDVTDADAMRDAVEAVFEAEETVRAIVNVAGMGWFGDFIDLPVRGWQRMLDVNLSGVFYGSQAFTRCLVRRKQRGSVLTVTSINQFLPIGGIAAYCAAKAGAGQLMKAMALELGKHGIRANAIAPGAIETPMLEPLMANPDLRRDFLASIPLGRLGRPSDIAAMARFLISEEAEWITGGLFVVDGGMTLIGEPSPIDYVGEMGTFERVKR